MASVQHKTFGLWSEPARDVFNFWISFSPMAPLFGVEWRFSQDAAVMTDKAQRTVETVTEAAEEVVETVIETTTAAVETVAETAVETSTEVAETVSETAAAPVEEVAETEEVVETVAAADPEAGAAPAGLLQEKPVNVDDLTQLNGVGPALARQLNGMGVYQFAQIAQFSKEDLAWVDGNLSGIKGRCYRDNWVGQAKARLN